MVLYTCNHPMHVYMYMYLYFKVHGGHFRMRFRHSGVKVRLTLHIVGPSHYGRFEDVATPTIASEQPLVQVHVNICGNTRTCCY